MGDKMSEVNKKFENKAFNSSDIPCQEISDQAVLSIHPKVSVHMITYNHEPYIAKAIEGVVRQKTEFPIELIIGEDCSTDRTFKIILAYQKKHPELIRVLTSNKNVGERNNNNRTIEACRGKYVAICEGDDYWTDPLKLQRQVYFLETNPAYGMTYSKVRYFIQKKNKYDGVFGGDKETFEDLLLGNSIPTLTTCFRLDLRQRYNQDIKPEAKNWLMGDYPMWLYFAKESKIKFENKVTGVYRVLENSASNSTNIKKNIEFRKSFIDIGAFFCDKYCINDGATRQKFELFYSWELFRFWTICQAPNFKKQALEKLANVTGNKSLKLKFVRLTFSFPIFRYLFIIYDHIGLAELRQRLKRYGKTP